MIGHCGLWQHARVLHVIPMMIGILIVMATAKAAWLDDTMCSIPSQHQELVVTSRHELF